MIASIYTGTEVLIKGQVDDMDELDDHFLCFHTERISIEKILEFGFYLVHPVHVRVFLVDGR
jgi:hypothetical protein